MVQDLILNVTHVEQILQRQVIYGGDFATNLLEMNLVDEVVLSKYLGRVVRLPVFPSEYLLTTEPSIIEMLPWKIANERRVIPVRIKDDVVTIVSSGPVPRGTVDEISKLFGMKVESNLVLEFRLVMALNRFYGIPMTARLAAIQKKLVPEFLPDQPPMVPEPPDDTIPIASMSSEQQEASAVPADESEGWDALTCQEPVLIVESKNEVLRPDESTRKFITGSRESTQRVVTLGHAADATSKTRNIPNEMPSPTEHVDREPPEARKPVSVPAKLSFSRATELLEVAKDRDEILDILFSFASQAFEFTALLLVHGKIAEGRTLVFRGKVPQPAGHVRVPLDQDGMFLNVFETRGFHLGPVGVAQADVDLLSSLRRDVPKSCAVIPIFLRGRMILMLYGDSGQRGVRANRITRIADFGRVVGQAFERILLKQKYSQYEKAKISDEGKVQAGPIKVEPRKRDFTGWASSTRAASIKSEPEKSSEVIDEKEWPSPTRESPPHVQTTTPAAGSERPAVVMITPANMISTPAQPAVPVPFAERITESPLEANDIASGPANPDPNLVKRVEVIDTRNVVYTSLASADPDRFEEPKKVLDVEPIPRISGAPAPEREDPLSQPKRVVDVENLALPLPQSVQVDMREEVDRLVERVLSLGPFDDVAAGLLVGIGDDALRALIPHFPGPLNFDRYQGTSRLRLVGQHGPLLRTMLLFGRSVTARLLPLLDSLDSEVRFYTVFLMTEIPMPEALAGLAKRVFDNDRQIRVLSIDVMKGLSSFPEYRWAVKDVASVLTSSTSTLEKKRLAAEALGELRDPVSIPSLSEMLGSVDGVLAERCQRSLVKITFTDFGFSERRWMSWWQANKRKHRIEWAVNALNHRVEEIRRAALEDLRKMVDGAFEWSREPLDHKQRRELKRRCLQWWEREGRALNPVVEVD